MNIIYSLSFSISDLTILSYKVLVNVLFMFFTLSNFPGGVFSTDFSNISM